MKTTTKKLLIICVSALALLAVCGLVAGLLLRKAGAAGSNTIAFYRVPQNVQTAVINLLNEDSENQNQEKAFEAVILCEDLSLEAQKKKIKKCDAVIFINDIQTAEFFEGPVTQAIELSLADGYPSSIRSSLKISGAEESGKSEKSSQSSRTVKILPFLYDFYEIDVHYPFYKKSGMKSIDVWDDLAETAYRELPYTKLPVILPAADDREFLNILGLIAEALSGCEAYDEMIENFDLEAALQNGKPLALAVNEMRGFLQHELMPYDSIRFLPEDILFYMDHELSGIYFTKLSQHRKISNRVVNNYTSIYCPSKVFTEERKFAAEQYSISLIKKTPETSQLVKKLSDNLQYELATKTGLAPVQKNCAVPDHQADDVRFWLAASKGPVMPLANLFRTDEDRHSAASRLRELIQ